MGSILNLFFFFLSSCL